MSPVLIEFCNKYYFLSYVRCAKIIQPEVYQKSVGLLCDERCAVGDELVGIVDDNHTLRCNTDCIRNALHLEIVFSKSEPETVVNDGRKVFRNQL